MGKIKLMFLVCLFLSLFVNIVTAQPPFQEGDFLEGYVIQVPTKETYKQNQDFQFNFHVFNRSDGAPIDNSSTNCFFHLYNSSGKHIFTTELNYLTMSNVPNEWNTNVDGGNFSDVGKYSFIVQCNSTNKGGFRTVNFLVTAEGFEPSTPQALMYGFVIFILFCFFIGSFIWFVNIPWGHYTDGEGTIVQVNTDRTKKLALFFLSYLMLLLLMFVGKNMTLSFMFLDDTPVFFETFFMILLVGLVPVFICITALTIISIISNTKLQNAIFRGLEIKA